MPAFIETGRTTLYDARTLSSFSRLRSTWAVMGNHKDARGTAGTSLDRPISTQTSEEAAEMDRALGDAS